ncbi:MAG: 16S rRNA (cytidine(1402)-2'-O)-methyltransferase [Candidatus Omnitrophica bacterium]|nr:16S rRNA (cytidine(1402)-2'-O)-methyltransferase [Candidatus Omnitrophota bacterium]
MSGTLFVIATPIGNLKDITLRALETLKQVDLIACEDTRHTQKLLSHYQIQRPLTSLFEHNERLKVPALVRQLQEGKTVGLVSDAGTPGISDPGFVLIREAIQNEIPVVPIPGPSAIITALIVSGMPTDRFCFEGFLPQKSAAMRRKLEELKNEPRTLIFYESPHRVLKTLQAMLELWGDIPIVCARELTKLHEEILRKPISQQITHLQKNTPRGEFVLVVNLRQKE